ncbi:hypothetical protein GFS24_25955 [Chitinophaga sp. SYP-B3965]|uniref:hypothetical protein n=1 Tax=Chitinophaga sp. SYP-B3965 TaxID=2663120 RepID=UPI0012998656|nr:hypothetical protein [Chitinophaga sp. SYP-B3965]MRG48588.1 hypothetical protein [Chitinophaga sp. SYP-B3965]
MIDYTEYMLNDVALFKRLVKENREKPLTAEEATKKLQDAGILDENGEHTKPYENLGRWIKENNPGKVMKVMKR